MRPLLYPSLSPSFASLSLRPSQHTLRCGMRPLLYPSLSPSSALTLTLTLTLTLPPTLTPPLSPTLTLTLSSDQWQSIGNVEPFSNCHHQPTH